MNAQPRTESYSRSCTTRRKFLATGAIVAPMILSSGILGAAGRPGANDRIKLAILGVGGKGKHLMPVIADHVGALCDVDTLHLEEGIKQLGRDVPVYTDYRRVLERKDIDAVYIAAPDHWHAMMTIDACQAGKDVYVEKPASRYVEEGRAMAKVAQETGRIVQVGSQGRCHPGGNALREFIQAGSIGKITHVECWHNDNYVGGDPLKISAPPPHLDWDMWLGQLRKRAYNPDYCHRFFRRMFDIGGGQILDRGAHVFNLVSWILGLDRMGPSRIVAKGDSPTEGLWDCPINFQVDYEFTDPELTIHWEQPGVRAGDFEFGAVYHGTRGKTVVRGGDGRVFPDNQVVEFAESRNIQHALKPGERADGCNMRNWMDCIKSRKQPIMDIESGHRIATMCLLANISWQIGRPVEWDAMREHIIRDRPANRLLGGAGRGVYGVF